MSMIQTNGTAGHRAYAPPKTDPVRLADITIRAVDTICNATAEEIDATAEEVIKSAEVVANNLRKLASAIREHGTVAAEHLSGYVNKTTNVLEGVRALQKTMNGKTDEEEERLPSVVMKGPRED